MSEMCAIFGTPHLERTTLELMTPTAYGPRTGFPNGNTFRGSDIQERWFAETYTFEGFEAPATHPESVYHTDADTAAALPKHQQRISNVVGEREWYQVGARVLRLAVWRPDCTQPIIKNIKRALPPRQHAWISDDFRRA